MAARSDEPRQRVREALGDWATRRRHVQTVEQTRRIGSSKALEDGAPNHRVETNALHGCQAEP